MIFLFWRKLTSKIYDTTGTDITGGGCKVNKWFIKGKEGHTH